MQYQTWSFGIACAVTAMQEHPQAFVPEAALLAGTQPQAQKRSGQVHNMPLWQARP